MDFDTTEETRERSTPPPIHEQLLEQVDPETGTRRPGDGAPRAGNMTHPPAAGQAPQQEGHRRYLVSGVKGAVRPPSLPQSQCRLGRGIFLGSIAAAVGAGVWTAIVVMFQYEVGYVAWGIGFLTGIVTLAGAGAQSKSLGFAAMLLAFLALAAGKAMSFELATLPQYVEDLAGDDRSKNAYVFLGMRDEGKISDELSSWMAGSAANEAPPLSLESEYEAYAQEFSTRKNRIDRRAFRAWLKPIARQDADQLSLTDKYDLTGYDMLWCLLALGSAWQICRPKQA